MTAPSDPKALAERLARAVGDKLVAEYDPYGYAQRVKDHTFVLDGTFEIDDLIRPAIDEATSLTGRLAEVERERDEKDAALLQCRRLLKDNVEAVAALKRDLAAAREALTELLGCFTSDYGIVGKAVLDKARAALSPATKEPSDG